MKKQVPRTVRLWLLMVGYCLGLLVGGFVIGLVNFPSNIIIWGLIFAGSLGVVYIIEVRHREALVEWLPYFEKKKKEKKP